MRIRPFVIAALVTALAALASGLAPATAAPARDAAPSQTGALMAFNGYYVLDTNPDAFFYVNSTMTATDYGTRRTYSISLDLSLDGQTSVSVPFTGTFVGNRLVQRSARGPAIDLRFTRAPDAIGPTASIAGTITLPGQRPVRVTGTTYSNPTPASFWADQVYFQPATAAGGAATPKVRMTRGGGIYYRSLATGRWVKAKSYTYNLDMYYFALKDRDLIMGTAGASGKVANQMLTQPGASSGPDDLLTFPDAAAPTTGSANWYPNLTGGTQLADVSGYYPIGLGSNPHAFVSIQASLLADPSLSPDDLSRVQISVSTDGKNVRTWYYDVLGGMTFDGKVLRMPAQGITLSFVRRYDARTGTLFTMRGTIDGKRVFGQSSFNSIPLSAFAGTMRDKAGQHTLVITSEGDISLDGVPIPNYEYVPTMYIVAGPIPGTTLPAQPVTLLSLGFSGGSGRTAIVTTNVGTPQAQTFTVSAIPNP